MKALSGAILLASTLLLCSCANPWTTNTKRSAVEQYLLAHTIEQAAVQAGLGKYAGQKIFFDYSYLVPQDDKQYLQGRLEMEIARARGIIVGKQEEADVMIQPLCGVLATDINTFLIGTPTLPIPVPYTTLNIVIPEIPLFKIYHRSAYGRLAFNIFEAKTRKPIECIPMINASSHYKNWVVLLVPFKTTTLPMKDTQEADTDFEIL